MFLFELSGIGLVLLFTDLPTTSPALEKPYCSHTFTFVPGGSAYSTAHYFAVESMQGPKNMTALSVRPPPAIWASLSGILWPCCDTVGLSIILHIWNSAAGLHNGSRQCCQVFVIQLQIPQKIRCGAITHPQYRLPDRRREILRRVREVTSGLILNPEPWNLFFCWESTTPGEHRNSHMFKSSSDLT